MLYHYYHSGIVKKENHIVLDWEKVYNYKLAVSKEHSDIYKQHVDKQIEDKGRYHEIIQTQYYVNFNLTNNKLVSMERLKNNNIVVGDMESNIKDYNNNDIYRIGSCDLAITGDRSVLLIGLSSSKDNIYKSELKDIIVLKELGESLSIEQQSKKIIKECKANNLDYIIFDTTSQQVDNVNKIYKEFKKEGCKTQIVNYSFSGDNKSNLFYFLENAFYEGNITMPSLEYKEKCKHYKIMLEELCNLKKIKKINGTYTYSAPDDSFNDDFPMALALFNYTLFQIHKKISKRETVKLVDIEYFLTLRKYPTETNEPRTQKKQWLTC